MTRCPDPSTLERLFQGSLAAAERTAVEGHIDRCSGCLATLAELTRLFGSATWSGEAGSRSRRSTVETGASQPRDAEPPWSSPADLGRYRLLRRLGTGGMGMVFEAEDLELHRRVALKILHADPGADLERTHAQLLREARAMAQTNHPNIVAVYDVGRIGGRGREGAVPQVGPGPTQTNEQVFLAMELVEGSTLTAWLRGRGRSEILAAFVMAGRGLAAAHATGLVHRDFKPDNVLIGADGRARVTDFGLALAARLVTPAGDGAGRAAMDVRASMQIQTEQGPIVGTPAYMAPEQWRGRLADARTDQFAFCVALYEALVGVRPFVGDPLHALAHAVLTQQPRPPTPLPRWLQAALLRGLARDPAARFASMAELLAVLERDRVGPRRVALAVAGMGLVAALAGGGFAWATRPSPAPEHVAALTPTATPATPPTSPTPTMAIEGCRAASEAGGRWTEARRAALQAHVTGMDDGEALAAALLPLLDGWAIRWTSAAERVCRAPESDAGEAERRCLDAALEHFDATIELAGSLVGFKVASGLRPAAYRLPEPGRCHDARWRSLAPAAPPAEIAGKVALLRRQLAAVEAGVDLEQWVAVRKPAADLVVAAQALGYTPLVTEVQLAHGRLEWLAGETDSAIAWFEAAAETAATTNDERSIGLAALALVDLLGAGQLRIDEARTWSTIASALGARLDDAGLRGRTLLAEARALAAVAEHPEALAKLVAAEPLLREGYGELHPWLVELELARAEASLATAQLDAAERAALAAERMALATVGPHALLTVRATAERARVALARGQLDEAERLATTASKIPGVGRSSRHDLDRGHCIGLLGDIALARAEPAAALERYREAEVFLYAGPESALPLLWQGVAQLRLGERAAAFVQIDAGWARIDESWAADDLRRLGLLRLVGLAAVEAGALKRARVALERAVELADVELGYGPQLARAKADLGRLERLAGHPKEALVLLDASYVGMVGGFGQHHPEIVTVSLARADLAWELGDIEYAGGLYRVIADELVSRRGAQDPASLRAAARRSKN